MVYQYFMRIKFFLVNLDANHKDPKLLIFFNQIRVVIQESRIYDGVWDRISIESAVYIKKGKKIVKEKLSKEKKMIKKSFYSVKKESTKSG